jgi:hypothetical protein
MVMLAGLLIAAAAAYGAIRGFQFTDLDQAAPAPVIVDTAAASAVAPPPTPVLDEDAVRALARSEVRQVIRPRPARRAPASELAAAGAMTTPEPEAPSSESLPEPETAN